MNDTGGEFSELVADTGTAATTYTDNTVAASTHYTYRIKAINEHGLSERSRWFHIETLEVPVPAKPTGLNATATHDQVALTWDDPGDYSITGYVILRRHRYDDPKGHFDELVADTGTAATTYTDDTVEDSTHYTYRIKAINEYGGERALRQVVLRRVLPELEVQRRLLVDDFQLVVELDHVLVRRLVGAVGMLSLVFLIPFRILVPVIEVLIQLDSVPVIHLFPCCHSLIPCGFSRSLSTVLATNLFCTSSFCPWCQSRRGLARRWFASLAANPETRTEEPRWDSKTGGHRKPARRSCFRRNPLNCCPGSPAENPGNRRAIRLLEPLIPTSWRSSGSPEWGSWSQYQKDSGAGRKQAISGHLGGWPMEGVFFSYGVWSSHSVGVLRKGFSSF